MTATAAQPCPNPVCLEIQATTRHCESSSCTWRRCAACGWLRDRAGHAMPGRHA